MQDGNNSYIQWSIYSRKYIHVARRLCTMERWPTEQFNDCTFYGKYKTDIQLFCMSMRGKCMYFKHNIRFVPFIRTNMIYSAANWIPNLNAVNTYLPTTLVMSKNMTVLTLHISFRTIHDFYIHGSFMMAESKHGDFILGQSAIVRWKMWCILGSFAPKQDTWNDVTFCFISKWPKPVMSGISLVDLTHFGLRPSCVGGSAPATQVRSV